MPCRAGDTLARHDTGRRRWGLSAFQRPKGCRQQDRLIQELTLSEQNAVVVRRFFDELWNAGLLEAADELLAPNHVHHISGDDMSGPEAVKDLVTYLRSAFPDLRFVIEDELLAGDKVVVRWTAYGTHLGDFGGLSATGRTAHWTGIDIVELQDGRIVELWGNNDGIGLVEQLTD